MVAAKKYSELKLDRVSLRDSIPLPKPFAVLFEPTSICNFKCVCCFHNEPDIYSYLPKGSMKIDDLKKIADDLASWEGDKIKVIRIVGFGEPLLNSATPDMVKYIKDLDIAERVEITTNASLLTEECSLKLIEAGLDYLRCSIYSADRERHKIITQSKFDVDVIKKNIKSLKALRDERGSQKPFIYLKMLKSDEKSENKCFLREFSPIADEAVLEKKHQWLSKNNNGKKMRQVCPQPFKMLSIHYNGDVVLCDPDWKGNTCVGNALEENISSIWGGKKIREFWRMQLENRRHENPSCRDCSFLVDEYAIDDLERVSPNVLGEDI